MIDNFARGGAAINVLTRRFGAELVVVNVGSNAKKLPPSVIDLRVRPGTANWLPARLTVGPMPGAHPGGPLRPALDYAPVCSDAGVCLSRRLRVGFFPADDRWAGPVGRSSADHRKMKKVPKDSRMGCCALGGVSLLAARRWGLIRTDLLGIVTKRLIGFLDFLPVAGRRVVRFIDKWKWRFFALLRNTGGKVDINADLDVVG